MREIELKFAVPADRAEAIWRAIAPNSGEGKTLRSTYFDTAERRLAGADFGLRIRDDGAQKIQTLKGPDPQGFTRAEYEAPVEGPGIDLAALAATPAAGLLEGAELAPLFSVEVTRRKQVMTRGGAEIEVCLDTGWVEGGGVREPINEIELELKSGPARALFGLARSLQRHDRPMVLAFETKAGRGLRLVDGVAARAPVVDPSMDAASAFTAIGQAALAQIAAAGAALEQEITPEGVHQLRVGLRRLRSARSAFKPMLLDKGSEAAAAELKWLAGALDEMRDLDVLAQSVADADAAFHAVLEAARAAARARLAAVLASPRRRALPLKIAEWLTVGTWRTSRLKAVRAEREQSVSHLAAAALDKRLGKLNAGEVLERLEPEARHAERIKVKKLRYAAEAFGPLFDAHPKRRKRMIAALKTAQESLGELNDDVVGREIAHRLVAASGDAEAAFAAGSAFAPDPRRAAKRLKAAQAAWNAMFDDKPFWR